MKRPRTIAERRKNVRKLARLASRPLTEARVREIAREEASSMIRSASFRASPSSSSRR